MRRALTLAALPLVVACQTDAPPGQTYFDRVVEPILLQSCARNTGGCHKTDKNDPFQMAAGNLDVTTYENVRLLLLSKSPAFPNGLSNNHSQVGRHYFSHAQFGGVAALFPFDLRNWYGTPGQGICVDNWADDNFDHSGLDFIGGGTMYVYSERRPMAAVSRRSKRRARWSTSCSSSTSRAA